MRIKTLKMVNRPMRIIEDELRSRKKGGIVPKWIPALTAFPPPPPARSTVVYPNSTQFVPSQLVARIHSEQMKFSSMTSRQKVKKAVYNTTPPVIVFEEDLIRDAFYAQHPFELDRPRDLSYETLPNLQWTSIHGSDAVSIPLSGESVVQRTLYLSKEHDLDTSYRQAVSEFHNVRRAQEVREEEVRSQEHIKGLARYKEEERIKNEELQALATTRSSPLLSRREGVKPALIVIEPKYFFGRPSSLTFMNFERTAINESEEFKKESMAVARLTRNSAQ